MATDNNEVPQQGDTENVFVGVREGKNGYDFSHAAIEYRDRTGVEEQLPRKRGGISALSQRLAVVLPDFTEVQRFQEWVRQRRGSFTEMNLSDEIPGIAKTPYIDSKAPDVIIKKYSMSPEVDTSKLDTQHFTSDRESFSRAGKFIPPEFLADTRFVELSDTGVSDYYQIQDKLEGFRFKSIDQPALLRFHELTQLDATLADTLRNDSTAWIDFKRNMLKEALGDNRWNHARNQIARLIPHMKRLEDGDFRFRDADFFIDPHGNVTLFDFDILDMKDPSDRSESEEANNWRGWEDLKEMFQV